MLRRYMPKGSVELWGAKFIKSLVSITHKQWLYRNSDVHHAIDGISARQHQELTARIHCLLKTKKDSLHERHRHLMEVDFAKLGSGTTIARQVWVANVDMAISVARKRVPISVPKKPYDYWERYCERPPSLCRKRTSTYPHPPCKLGLLH